MISDKEIIQQLRDKEAVLVSQLEKVRLAINAFMSENILDSGIEKDIEKPKSLIDELDEEYEEKFDQYLSYDQKVILALSHIKTGYINDMVDKLKDLGDSTEESKLFQRLTTNASKLLGKGILIADKRGKRYRYSLNPETEQERAEILPLF